MDKLLRLSTPGMSRDVEDLSIYKPNLEALDEEGTGDVQQPDAATEDPEELMELDERQEQDAHAKKRKKRGDRAMKRSGGLLLTWWLLTVGLVVSGMLEEMKNELLDAPEEQQLQGARIKHDEEAAQKASAHITANLAH